MGKFPGISTLVLHHALSKAPSKISYSKHFRWPISHGRSGTTTTPCRGIPLLTASFKTVPLVRAVRPRNHRSLLWHEPRNPASFDGPDPVAVPWRCGSAHGCKRHCRTSPWLVPSLWTSEDGDRPGWHGSRLVPLVRGFAMGSRIGDRPRERWRELSES